MEIIDKIVYNPCLGVDFYKEILYKEKKNQNLALDLWDNLDCLDCPFLT